MILKNLKKAVNAAQWMKGLSLLSRAKHSADDLEFVRTTEVNLIPRRLFKHVHDKVFDPQAIDRIYQFGDSALRDPTSFLWLMVDRVTRAVHGVLWVNLSVFDAEMSVFLMSVDPAYRSGNFPTVAANFIFSQPFDWEQIKPVINFMTTRPHVWEKLGCARHKLTGVCMTKEFFDSLECQRLRGAPRH